MAVKYGIIAIIDLLGTKQKKIDECDSFIKFRDKQIDNAQKAARNILCDLNCEEKIDVSTFGDTIIICWPFNDKDKTGFYLLGMSHLLKVFFTFSFEEKYFFRGSIGIGEYIKTDNTLLGPGINEVASWFEKTNWIGVHLTPKCGINLQQYVHESKNAIQNLSFVLNKTPLDFYYVKYSIPLKDDQEDMYALSWPAEYLIIQEYPQFEKVFEKISARWFLLNKFSGVEIPLGTEKKYENTIAFYDWYASNIYPKLIRALRKNKYLNYLINCNQDSQPALYKNASTTSNN